MIRLPPRSTRTSTLFPYTTLFRSNSSGMAIQVLKALLRLSGFRHQGLPAATVVAPKGGKHAVQFKVATALGHSRAGQHRQSICRRHRSEEHTSELQSLMRISYAVLCLKKKNATSSVTQ